jgi:hypothetical protein
VGLEILMERHAQVLTTDLTYRTPIVSQLEHERCLRVLRRARVVRVAAITNFTLTALAPRTFTGGSGQAGGDGG